MPWPPVTLPVDKTNATVLLDDHPDTHNQTNSVINNDIVPKINSMEPTAWVRLPEAGNFIELIDWPLSYRRHQLGNTVEIRGAVSVFTGGTSAGDVVCTLPAGARPVYRVGLSVAWDEDGTNNWSLAPAWVEADGRLRMGTGITYTGFTKLYFDGTTFSIDPAST